MRSYMYILETEPTVEKDMKYTKMHGAGNDFIIINNMVEKIPLEKYGEIARTLCTRRLSIGADGLMVVEAAENDGDFRMIFYNSDGSKGEMCGNGARCISRYGYENGLAGEIQKVETPAGLVIGCRENKRLYRIRLNDLSVLNTDYQVVLPSGLAEKFGNTLSCTYIEMGNPGLPHLVVEMPGLSGMKESELRELGAFLRSYPELPKGANVNFCEVTDKDKIKELTYERGVEDFTLACGTGTGSTVAALTARDLVSGKNVEVDVPGGTLYVTLQNPDKPEENIFLTGPTNIVAIGEVTDEDLKLEF